jgi:hypothetical protein
VPMTSAISTKFVTWVLVIGALVALPMASVRRYIVWDHELGTQLLWSPSDAYLFIAMRRSGWWGSNAEFAWQTARNILGSNVQVKDASTWVLIVRITPDRVEQRVIEGGPMPQLSAVGDEIFGAYNGALAKWTINGVETASAEERKRFEASRSSGAATENLGAWSKRVNLLSRPAGRTEYPLAIHSHEILVVARIDDSPEKVKSLEVRFPGQATQPIWSVSEKSRRVSQNEYAKLLGEFP